MIFDKIENINKYLITLPNGKLIEQYLISNNLDSISIGKTALKEDEVILNISEYLTKDRKNSVFETHKKFVDIQIVLSGKERIEYCDAAYCTAITEYSAEKDIQKYSLRENMANLIMQPGMFAVFFQDDAHMPSLLYEKVSKVKKLVIKTKVLDC